MLYMHVSPATVTLINHKSLRAAQATFPRETMTNFVVQEPLTPSQFRRLPAWLRERTKYEVSAGN